MTTIGACGYIGTGSSAITDLLKEFEETQLLSSVEFTLTYIPDGLEDLDYHVNNFRKYMSSVVAIQRFREMVKRQHRLDKGTNFLLSRITDEFIEKLGCVKWRGAGFGGEYFYKYTPQIVRRILHKGVHLLKSKPLIEVYKKSILPEFEMTVFPDDFDKIAHDYVSLVLDALGRDPNKITVVEQPFEGCNPVKSFKYYDNPRAITVDRDPRDHYLAFKCFYRPKGLGYQVPNDNVHDYIRYYKYIHKSPEGLRNRTDILKA